MYDVFERLCKEKGVTAYKVAKATGISTATFSNWKAGRSVPKTDKLQLIADYFDVPLETFTGARKKKITAVFHQRGNVTDPTPKTEKAECVDLFVGRPKVPFTPTEEIVKMVLESLKEKAEEKPEEFMVDVSKYEMPQEEVILLEHYRAADPGTQASVRKLLDMEDSTMPIAAHPDDGAPLEGQMEDAKMVEESVK